MAIIPGLEKYNYLLLLKYIHLGYPQAQHSIPLCKYFPTESCSICYCTVGALQYVYVSSYSILIKCNFCNFTESLCGCPPALDARGRRPAHHSLHAPDYNSSSRSVPFLQKNFDLLSLFEEVG